MADNLEKLKELLEEGRVILQDGRASYSVGLALFAEAHGCMKVAEVRDRKGFRVLGEEA